MNQWFYEREKVEVPLCLTSELTSEQVLAWTGWLLIGSGQQEVALAVSMPSYDEAAGAWTLEFDFPLPSREAMFFEDESSELDVDAEIYCQLDSGCPVSLVRRFIYAQALAALKRPEPRVLSAEQIAEQKKQDAHLISMIKNLEKLVALYE